jgi:hypothetical protein
MQPELSSGLLRSAVYPRQELSREALRSEIKQCRRSLRPMLILLPPFRGPADMAGPAAGLVPVRMTHSRRWMFGCIFGLKGARP